MRVALDGGGHEGNIALVAVGDSSRYSGTCSWPAAGTDNSIFERRRRRRDDRAPSYSLGAGPIRRHMLDRTRQRMHPAHKVGPSTFPR